MGLDTTHDCWHGAYSSFAQFRKRIAKALGFDLETMVGFGGVIEWSTLALEPLVVLLDHSDCDGHIEVADLIPLAERLEAIAPKLTDNDPHAAAGTLGPDFFRDYYINAAKRFAAGCRKAAELGERVEFH